MKLASRYHPLLVTLHWLLAVLILLALAVGFLGLAAMENADPAKITVLRWHMAGGMLILALMIVRFIVRLWTAKPPPANRLAPVVHWGFYLLVVLMVATGFATGLAAGLPEIVFAGSGAPLPQEPPPFRRGWRTSGWRRCYWASSSCTSALPCIISSSDGTDCCDGWASGVGCKLATWPHGPSTCQVT